MTNFSQRTDWDLRQNELTSIENSLRQSGAEVDDLTISNPTRCDFVFPEAEINKAFQHPDNFMYCPEARGLVTAREAVCEYYAEKGVRIAADQVFLTASTSEAYGFLFRLLADPFEHIIFPKPSYPLFEFLAGLHDLTWETYRLVYDNNWRLDTNFFKETAQSKARAVVLVNPNNPTGSCLNDEELQCVYSSAIDQQIPVICDEVFLDYGFDQDKQVRTLAGRKDQLTFVLGGLSKTLAMPQMKCSWIIVSGPDKEVSDAVSRLDVISDTYLSVNTPVQNALPELMRFRGHIQSAIMKRILTNRRFLSERVEKHDRVELLNADGGWTAVLRVDGIDDELFVLRLLKEEKVLIHPGYFFDFHENGFFVLSLLTPEEVFKRGIEKFLLMIMK